MTHLEEDMTLMEKDLTVVMTEGQNGDQSVIIIGDQNGDQNAIMVGEQNGGQSVIMVGDQTGDPDTMVTGHHGDLMEEDMNTLAHIMVTDLNHSMAAEGRGLVQGLDLMVIMGLVQDLDLMVMDIMDTINIMVTMATTLIPMVTILITMATTVITMEITLITMETTLITMETIPTIMVTTVITMVLWLRDSNVSGLSIGNDSSSLIASEEVRGPTSHPTEQKCGVR